MHSFMEACNPLNRRLFSHLMSGPDTISQLQNSLDRLIPPGVGAVARGIADREDASDYPEERRNEFIAGRHCAREALARIGVSSCALPPDKNRAPQWPEGVIGSISHTGGLCCSVAAYRDAIVAFLGQVQEQA